MFRNKKLAVIGDPIKHSLSPVMHNAAISALDLDLEYSAVELKQYELEAFVGNAKKEFLGFNVTVPHKQNIIPYLDKISENSILCNSVNTVIVYRNGVLSGDTTDGVGLSMALKELFNVSIKNSSFLFIGCGGAAQAASTYLLSKNARKVFFVNRTLTKAKLFSEKLKSYFGENKVGVFPILDKEKIALFLRNFNPIIIQSTTLGLGTNDPCPIPEDFFLEHLIYFDMIYNKNTKFLENAKKYNCRNADGRLMLLYQGVKSFELWTNINPPIDVMKKALLSSMT